MKLHTDLDDPLSSVSLDPSSPFFLDHVSRYWWAARVAVGKTVLDCACGKGYGSYILSRDARSVLGIDLSPASIDTARAVFRRENLEFRRHDVLKAGELGRKFDLITAFEVIEHLRPEEADGFVAGLAGSLAAGGILLLSTPNHDVVTKSGSAVPDFHVNNYRPGELRKALRRHFRRVTLLGQFPRRSGIARIVFDLDFLNLRHAVVGRLLRALRPTRPETPAGPRAAGDPTADEIRGWFARPHPGVERYAFSPRHWRQAGLTVAVCSNGDLPPLMPAAASGPGT